MAQEQGRREDEALLDYAGKEPTPMQIRYAHPGVGQVSQAWGPKGPCLALCQLGHLYKCHWAICTNAADLLCTHVQTCFSSKLPTYKYHGTVCWPSTAGTRWCLQEGPEARGAGHGSGKLLGQGLRLGL